MPSEDLTLDELQTAFQSLFPNKSPGLDEISVNIVKNVYDIIEPLLFPIFSLSLKRGIFPDSLKKLLKLPRSSNPVTTVRLEIIDQFQSYPAFQKFSKESCITGYTII